MTLHAACLIAMLMSTAVPCLAAEAANVKLQGDAIVFDGRIDEAAAARFIELLQAPQVARLVITSRGGLVAPALEMAQALHARGLDVEVPQMCFSSCANYIFPAGRRKFLGHADAVAWHGNMAHVLYLQQTGQATWDEGPMRQARTLAQREAVFYRAIGVDGFIAWFGKLPPYDAPDFYSLPVQDMARFGVGGVFVGDAQTPAPPMQPEVQRLHIEGDVPLAP